MPKKEAKKIRGVFERPKGSGVWWICYFDQYGRKHREKVGLKTAATKRYQQRKTEILLDRFNPEEVMGKHRRALVSEVIDDYIQAAEGRRLKALEDVKQRLGWFRDQIGNLPARSLSANDIEACRRKLSSGRLASNKQKLKEGGRTVATVNRYLASLKAAFYLAVKNSKVEPNPVSLVKLAKENNKRVRFLTGEEEERLMKVTPRDYHTLEFSEETDHHPGNKVWEARRVPMNDVVIEALKALPTMLHNPFVFYGREPGQRLKNGIKHSDWEKYLEAAGIEDLH